MNRIFRRTLALALFASLAACSPQHAAEAAPAAPAPETHPVSGLPVVPLTVKTGTGTHALRVEVAATAAQQAQGLMFRTAMGPDEGMIFPRNPPDVASFWMKNTPLPLDIIFIGTDRKVINVAANTVPYSLAPVGSAGVAAAVLELNAGRAAELGIAPGTQVAW
ncbi:DUF192 domain-containing protein [Tsuneonella sp. YG55]|uniref:DUF192 domain-containing protein n=1 Tax=Tsuneonella litorea TaxID=2976475 RepID=A0A9X3A8G1_9SPHN|nr:DUF192 domain-containing protein [Tsuneonella litorea]MCT2559441.1 DUF192 domain-containing protein [Tsuneonella litorea]